MNKVEATPNTELWVKQNLSFPLEQDSIICSIKVFWTEQSFFVVVKCFLLSVLRLVALEKTLLFKIKKGGV